MFSMKQIFSRIKWYFRGNLGAPFIIVFQALMLICAGLLILGDSELANGVAMGAYVSLVIGVVLQLFSFLMRGRNLSKNDGEA